MNKIKGDESEFFMIDVPLKQEVGNEMHKLATNLLGNDKSESCQYHQQKLRQ